MLILCLNLSLKPNFNSQNKINTIKYNINERFKIRNFYKFAILTLKSLSLIKPH